MPVHRDPAAAAVLAEHHGEALAVARREYPGLSSDDHHDIVQEAFARVLARLQRGPLVDPRSYLLRVVYTSGAYVLRDRHRQVLSLDQHREDQDGVAPPRGWSTLHRVSIHAEAARSLSAPFTRKEHSRR